MTLTLKDIAAAVETLYAANAPSSDGVYTVHIHPTQILQMSKDGARGRRQRRLRIRKDGLAGKNVIRKLGRRRWRTSI